MRIRRATLVTAAGLLLAAGCTAGPTVRTAPPPTTAATFAPSVPASEDPAGAYARLLSMIPDAIAPSCEPTEFTETFPAEPGQLAGADCDLPIDAQVDFVNYELYVGQASMDATYDLLARGFQNGGGTVDGPSCPEGPGPIVNDDDRALCYMFLVDDAQIQWTDRAHFIFANAFHDDGDWQALFDWWMDAGPVAP